MEDMAPNIPLKKIMLVDGTPVPGEGSRILATGRRL